MIVLAGRGRPKSRSSFAARMECERPLPLSLPSSAEMVARSRPSHYAKSSNQRTTSRCPGVAPGPTDQATVCAIVHPRAR